MKTTSFFDPISVRVLGVLSVYMLEEEKRTHYFVPGHEMNTCVF